MNTSVIVVGALLLLAPAAFAQPDTEGPTENAPALCIAAGEQLARWPGPPADVPGTVRAWRQILHVMEETEDRRQVVLDSARAKLAGAASNRAALLGQVNWPNCARRDYQVRYLAAYAPAERILYNLPEEPGTPLEAAVARRLNRHARCLAASELATIRDADPPPPDAAALQAIRERSIQQIDAVPGSAVGKELVLDVARYILNPTPENKEAQRGVANRASLILQTC
ncbi:MAG TPA: hypothetical protein VF613_09395 [Longimicrobium sp.]|jgi:hypothetical protein